METEYRPFKGLLILAVLAGLFWYTRHDIYAPPVNSRLAALFAGTSDAPLQLGQRTKTSNCRTNGPLPDADCSPGAVFPGATIKQICVPGYTKTVRNVSASLKKKVYQEYGLAYPQAIGSYETDHIIPLELGGSNEISNLFPEAAAPKPGFKEKDLVENYLNQQVCGGGVALAAAQERIAKDWTSVYNSLTPDEIQKLKQQYASWAGN